MRFDLSQYREREMNRSRGLDIWLCFFRFRDLESGALDKDQNEDRIEEGKRTILAYEEAIY